MKNNEEKTEETNNSGYFFEGAEKRLEIDFIPTRNANKRGMLQITRTQWDSLLCEVNCLINHETITDSCHSYVLSESSLFVYPFKILIKTCGRTTLLDCLDLLLRYSQMISLKVDFVTYSHRAFSRPAAQTSTYSSFDNEINELNRYFDGKGYTLGPMNSEPWFLYVADLNRAASSKEECEQTIEIMMGDLDKKSMSMFYKNSEIQDVTTYSGISEIIPNSHIDDKLFDPCGYSMNGLKGKYYSTIHITPEHTFSYVSFETNLPVESYDAMIRKVLEIFNPGRFIVSVFADSDSLCGESNRSYSCIIPGYTRGIASTCEFLGRRSVTCSHFYRN